ncbi:hypothetical protein B1A99_28940 [Cohnella sp. CIP 111063]|uniref:hypothetical protein n=1 Tax=unclassified Cohnella TaxID=2636738 RepID=UPI000B8C0DA8|nr:MULTISPECIES: hypothetical protein [unclassified Cohnella]OXS53681.1 hypothetical protein B1A99_28940 [Cohnella sp. CIP 111063]PRX61964.1 hypothetical protein B0G52_12430 [Cohnella sp. SGD-V74]
MWTQLAEFLQANGRETLIISVVGTLLVWMYKQFKGMIDREQQEKLATVQLKQTLFTKLELNLASVLHLGDEESKRRLLELLGECGPYLTRMQRTLVRDYCKSFDPGVLHTLQELTIYEADKLDRQMEKLGETKDSGEWFIYIQRLYAPVWPIITFALVGVYIFGLFLFVGQGATSWIQINILISGISILLSVSLVVAGGPLVAKNKMGKQGAKRWGVFALILLSPSLILIELEMSLVSIAIQVTALVFLWFNKRPPGIIRL